MPSINSLITNRWEFYDVGRMRRLKLAIVLPLVVVLWLCFYVLVNTMADLAGFTDLGGKLLASVLVLAMVMALVMMKINQMDRGKKDWYFAALQHSGLKREEVLDLIKEFLARQNYQFNEASTHRTVTLWITYFEIPNADFKVRLWFSVIGGTPIAEVGLGPETALNKRRIEELRMLLSREIAVKYGALDLSVPAAGS